MKNSLFSFSFFNLKDFRSKLTLHVVVSNKVKFLLIKFQVYIAFGAYQLEVQN